VGGTAGAAQRGPSFSAAGYLGQSLRVDLATANDPSISKFIYRLSRIPQKPHLHKTALLSNVFPIEKTTAVDLLGIPRMSATYWDPREIHQQEIHCLPRGSLLPDLELASHTPNN
jgi:hypothetical protein